MSRHTFTQFTKNHFPAPKQNKIHTTTVHIIIFKSMPTNTRTKTGALPFASSFFYCKLHAILNIHITETNEEFETLLSSPSNTKKKKLIRHLRIEA